MSGGKLVAQLTVSVSLSLALCAISFGATLEIEQEGYLYQMPLTQDVYTETFVVSPIRKQLTATAAAPLPEPDTAPPSAQFTNPVMVYFQINSPALSADAARKLRSELSQRKVGKTTQLLVTGYTCWKGLDRFNEWLAHERAKAVAEMLRKEGYTVAKIEGRGASNLVSTNHPSINRRVEITVFDL